MKKEINQAEVFYSRGYRIRIPKTGFAPMLLLEWLCQFRAGSKTLHAVKNTPESFEFVLNVKSSRLYECVKYINDNL